MTRPKTALCAVATAFVCLAPAAFASEAKHLPKVHAAPVKATTQKSAVAHPPALPVAPHALTMKRPAPHAHDSKPVLRGEAPAASARVTAQKAGTKADAGGAAAAKDVGRASAKTEPKGLSTAQTDDEPVIRLEEAEPPATIGVTPRSRTIAVLEGGRKDSARGGRGAKHAMGRLIRPLPPNASWTKYRHEPWRRGYVSVFGHGKQWSGYLIGRDGGVLAAARQSLSSALSSWRTGKQMLIDERLMGLIADVSDEFGGRPIRIVSGYREYSYAPDSKHKIGQAFDFSVPGVPNDVLRDFLRSLGDVGVGYYPNSTHVHLDVREKPTYWVDYSRPGEHPLYAYDQRVAGLTAGERALASALDELSAHPGLGLDAASVGGVPARSPAATREMPSDGRARSAPLAAPGRSPVVGRHEPDVDPGGVESSEDEHEPALAAGVPGASGLATASLPELGSTDDRSGARAAAQR